MRTITLKTFILFSLIFFFFTFSFAQREECGSILPNDFELQKYKKPEQYQKFMETFENNYLNRPPTAGSCINNIPMQVHIIRRSNGTGGLTISELNSAMTTLNLRYEAACMAFYVCGSINYIDDDQYYNFNTNDEPALTAANNVNDAINIYYANSVGNGSSNLCGYAYYPGGPDVILMANGCANNGSTLPHEVGHFYGLPHTHDQGNELVNGSNCATAGDNFCDTPADPNLSGVVNSSCVYTGTATDANGDTYIPDPTNIMSYSRKLCRTFFSSDQLAEIVFNNNFERNYFDCPDFDVDFTADITQSCTFPITVNFTETAVGETTYEWDFDNDGTVDATTPNPSHTYTSVGSYTVNLTVSDGTSSIAKVKTAYIEVGSLSFPHSSNLDNFTANTNATGFEDGWTASPSGTTNAYRWNTNNGETPSNNTGPEVDQSLGNATGIYVFSEASGYDQGDIAEITSPCLDVPLNAVDPYVSFHYHMYGSSMGNLHIDLFDGTSWINDITPAIIGQQQSAMSDPWIEKTFDITAYKGSAIQIRFRAIRGNGWQSDIAIDNLELLETMALPVELVNFEGKSNSKGENILSWETSSEINAFHFLVEHSEDGVQFETTGKVEAIGNTNSISNYRFIHYFPSTPHNYYRLKMIDRDESFEYSSIIYLPSEKQNSEITVFPNPSLNIFQLHRSKENSNWEILVFNSIGQLIKSTMWQVGEERYELNLEQFAEGVYTIQISNQNSLIGIHRLIKIK